MVEETKPEEFKEEVNPKKDNQGSENIIFVGNKPLVNYIKSVIMLFKKRNLSEITIKSRGKFISKAVDVTEVARRALEDSDIKVKDIKIASESFTNEDKTTNISTMEIILGKI